jgi:hypothetical protein
MFNRFVAVEVKGGDDSRRKFGLHAEVSTGKLELGTPMEWVNWFLALI